jgi:hypothetical protein
VARVLTDYELGQCDVAIEWVCRLGKPIADVGSRTLPTGATRADLEADLAERLANSSEVAGAYIIEENPGLWRFGFYSQPWALDALVSLFGEDRAISDFDRRWIAGLLFGYDAVAIQRFFGARSAEPTATLQVRCIRDTAGISPLPTTQCVPRSKWLAKSQSAGTNAQCYQSLVYPFSARRLVDRETAPD